MNLNETSKVKKPKCFHLDDAISPPVAALLQNQTEDTLLEDLYPSAGSAPGISLNNRMNRKYVNGDKFVNVKGGKSENAQTCRKYFL